MRRDRRDAMGNINLWGCRTTRTHTNTHTRARARAQETFSRVIVAILICLNEVGVCKDCIYDAIEMSLTTFIIS